MNSQIMNNTRLGCSFCFLTLDPRADGENLREFMQCTNCHSLYHKSCSNQFANCTRCNNSNLKPVTIQNPARLSPKPRSHPVQIKATSVLDSEGNRILGATESISRISIYVAQLLRGLLVGAIFVLVAALIGTYSYTLLNRTQIDELSDILSIIRQQPPSNIIFIAAITGGVIFGLVLFNWSSVSNRTGGGRPHWITRVLAAIAIVFTIDLLLLGISVFDREGIQTLSLGFQELFIAQVVTAVVVLVLAPIHSRIAPITVDIALVRHNDTKLLNIYGWARLLLVSLLVVFFVTLYFFLIIPYYYPETPIGIAALGGLAVPLTGVAICAFCTSLAIAAMAYWPPPFRMTMGSFAIVRILIIILCAVSVVFILRATQATEVYLLTVISSAAITIIMTPAQRVLS